MFLVLGFRGSFKGKGELPPLETGKLGENFCDSLEVYTLDS